VKKSITVRLER